MRKYNEHEKKLLEIIATNKKRICNCNRTNWCKVYRNINACNYIRETDSNIERLQVSTWVKMWGSIFGFTALGTLPFLNLSLTLAAELIAVAIFCAGGYSISIKITNNTVKSYFQKLAKDLGINANVEWITSFEQLMELENKCLKEFDIPQQKEGSAPPSIDRKFLIQYQYGEIVLEISELYFAQYCVKLATATNREPEFNYYDKQRLRSFKIIN